MPQCNVHTKFGDPKLFRGGSRRWSWGPNQGSGDGSPPVGSRGVAPVGGLGDGVPQKLEHFLKYAA